MNKRLDYIDILKGFSILCIVFIHFEEAVVPPWLKTWIGLFMISTFYFTSGWILGLREENISLKEHLLKRWKSLGVPYLWFSGLILVFEFVLLLFGYYDWMFIGREAYKTLVLRGIDTLWFLPALFFGELIFIWLKNKRSWLLIFGALLFTLVYMYLYGCWTSEYRNLSSLNQIIDAPFYTIRNFMGAWPVVAIGYLFAKDYKRILSCWSHWKIFLLSFVVICVSIYFASFSKLNLGVISHFLPSVLGPLGLLLLAKVVERWRVMQFFVYWGCNSMVLMIAHESFFHRLSKIFDKYVLGYDVFWGERTLVYFVVTVLLCYPIVCFFNNRARFMLGKK